jgi:ABC-type glycerol-3-phosphate transport system permease component
MELSPRVDWLKSAHRQQRLGNMAAYVILLAVAVTMFLPFLWMISTAFKPAQETFAYPPTFIPQNFTLDNFKEAWSAAPFGRYYLNSFRVAIVVTISQVFFCSLAGYIFAKLHFWGRNVLFILVVAKLMIPIQVLIVPLYLLIIRLALADTLSGVILPDLMGAFGIFMLRQFIVSLPNELIDSARLDGCSEFGIYWRIILPLIVPALAVFAIITFIDTWNDFLWPLIVISTPAKRTLPLGLAVFADEYVVENNLAMAASIIVLAPVVVVFAIFQRRIIDSVALSGLKEG